MESNENKYPPPKGTWILVAPDGRKWEADSPLHCCKKEMDERVPKNVQLFRILTALAED